MADYTILTNMRIEALRTTVETVSAKGGILFFTEVVPDGLLFLPSYAVGSCEQLQDKLRNCAIFQACDPRELSFAEVEKAVTEALEALEWRTKRKWLTQVRSISSQASLQEDYFSGEDGLALLALENEPEEPASLSDAQVSYLYQVLSLSREKRFREAIKRLTSKIIDAVEEKGNLVAEMTRVIAAEIGANRVSTNQVFGREVLEQTPSVESARQLSFRECDPITKSKAEFALVQIEPDALHLTLKEQSFELRSKPFSTGRQGDPSVRTLFGTQQITFAEKTVDGYLQSHFSKSDKEIAQAIFDLVSGYENLEKEEGVASQVLKNEQEQGVEDPSNTVPVLQLLPEARGGIEAVIRVELDLSKGDIELHPKVQNHDLSLSKSYVSRLKEFCRDFYFNGGACDTMQVGLEVNDERAIHEFHMPSRDGFGLIYLVVYSGRNVRCSTYYSVLRQMESFFLRMKRHEIAHTREQEIVEYRHLMVDYFRNVKESLELMQMDWDISLKDAGSWARLRTDDGFKELFDQAIWAIGHAGQILENGRLQTKDIDSQSIRKINTDIETIILNCKRLLQFEWKKKSIIWHHKVQGTRPSHVYSDPVLMQVALLNLFDNAVKYAPNGSTITISHTFKASGYEFSISNIGDYIAPERFKLLLQMGFRGRQSDQLNVRAGTGVGLTVTNTILISHSVDASLRLRSEKQNGGRALNTFMFEMPYLTGIERQGKARKGVDHD